MGSGEDSGSVKSSKQSAPPQNTPTAPAYQDCPPSMQVYYNAGGMAPGFFTPIVPSSGSPHPMMYHQHFLQYGTHVPFMHPHGGPYAHPTMAAMVQSVAPVTAEIEGKGPIPKDHGPRKKFKGSENTGIVGGKFGGSEKAVSASGNVGDALQSAESGNEASSNTSADNTDQKEVTTKRSTHRFPVDGADDSNTNQYNGVAIESSSSAGGQPVANPPLSMPGKPSTSLNIGMDIWNASPAGAMVPSKTRPNACGVSPSIQSMVGCEGVGPNRPWIQDERELKKQRRKQSNRESARRSRLRKQAECEELQLNVERLSNENKFLKNELTRLSEECVKLSKKNDSILEELKEVYGPDAISGFKAETGNEVNNHEDNDSSESNSASEDGSFFKSNGDLEDPN